MESAAFLCCTKVLMNQFRIDDISKHGKYFSKNVLQLTYEWNLTSLRPMMWNRAKFQHIVAKR